MTFGPDHLHLQRSRWAVAEAIVEMEAQDRLEDDARNLGDLLESDGWPGEKIARYVSLPTSGERQAFDLGRADARARKTLKAAIR